jgi:hypothetical protein
MEYHDLRKGFFACRRRAEALGSLYEGHLRSLRKLFFCEL